MDKATKRKKGRVYWAAQIDNELVGRPTPILFSSKTVASFSGHPVKVRLTLEPK